MFYEKLFEDILKHIHDYPRCVGNERIGVLTRARFSWDLIVC